MNVKSIEKEGSKAKVVVEVEAELLESGKQKAYLKARKNIMVPGFRKGKCPRQMIEAMYGADVFTEDGINEIFPEVYAGTVLKEENLKPVGMPTVVDMQFPEAGGVELTVETELYPEVTLGDYKGLEVPKAEATVSDDEIAAELNRSSAPPRMAISRSSTSKALTMASRLTAARARTMSWSWAPTPSCPALKSRSSA